MTEFKHYEDLAALVARLFMAILFILYGYFKLTGYAGTVAGQTRASGSGAFCRTRSHH